MNALLKAAVVAACAGCAVTSATAADWSPEGPIKLIIPFAGGGAADTQARLIAEALEARHGWKVIPEERTGKGGLIAAKELADSPNDGSVIAMMASETLDYNLLANPSSGLKPEDFTPIVTTAGFQMAIVGKPDRGWTTIGDVIEAARDGQSIRFATMSPKLADLAYILGRANDVEFNIISVRGGKAVLNGIAADDVDVGFAAGIQAKAVEAGDLVNLASALSVPLRQTPDAPLLQEFGVPFGADGYFVFVGPAGMDPQARQALAEAIGQIVRDPSSKAGGFIAKAFGEPDVLEGRALDAFMANQADGARKLLEAASE